MTQIKGLTKDLGISPITGLTSIVSICKLVVDWETENVRYGYKIYVLSPTGIIVNEPEMFYADRYNRPPLYHLAGTVLQTRLTEPNPDPLGLPIETRPEIIADGTEEIKPANMKWDILNASQAGLAINFVLNSELSRITDEETIHETLRQD